MFARLQLLLDAEGLVLGLEEDGVAVGVDRHGDAATADHLAEDVEVPLGVLLVSEDGPGDQAGGVVNGADQAQVWPASLEPVVAAGVNLEEHAGPGIPVTAAPVLGGTAATGGCDAGGF